MSIRLQPFFTAGLFLVLRREIVIIVKRRQILGFSIKGQEYELGYSSKESMLFCERLNMQDIRD
jgi:hypothetical protein